MGTLHKRTHRPLAVIALFALLGLIGWQLPHLGAGALAYSSQAARAARARFSNGLASGTASPANANANANARASAAAAQQTGLTEGQLKIIKQMVDDLDAGGEYSREEKYLLEKARAGESLTVVEGTTLISRVLLEEYVTKRPYSKSMARLLTQYRGFVRTSSRTIEDEKPGGEKGSSLKAPINAFGKAANGPSSKAAPAAPNDVLTASFSEGFDDITTLSPAGWFLQNNSNPLGTTNWFQGNPAVFPSQGGATNSYIGANFNNTSGAGNISNWLLTPQINFQNGDVIKFWTRKVSPDSFADRLQVRLSKNGASTNVGATDTTVGDFTTLLLDINPTLTLGVYPTVFTEFTVTISGLPAGQTPGRVGFRYFVTDGGPSGNNSDFIGIDTFSYTLAPPPAVIVKGAGTITSESCTAANNVLDPGETVTVSLCLSNTGVAASGSVVGTLVPNGTFINPSGAQTYGVVPTGGAPVCRSFTFTVPSNAACGGTITVPLAVTDGGTSVGTFNYVFPIGTTNAPTTVSTFTQNTPIVISTAAPPNPASPYPSTINVAGATGTVIGVKVKLNGVSHTFPSDIDALLVGPTGASDILLSDVGGGTAISNVNLTFADGSPSLTTGAITTGSYTPTNIGSGDTFSLPAPAASVGGPLNTTFGGLNPNGNWSLYVMDDASGDGGSITSWSIELTTTSVTPTITSTPFTNAAAITIPSSGAASPYPSTINVSGVAGTIRNIQVGLNGLSHTFPSDMDMLLVGPTGQAYTVLSDAGGSNVLSGVNLTIQDGSTTLPASLAVTTTIGPSNSGTGDTFPTPAPTTFVNAPTAGNATLLSTYGGLAPNGTWSLYVVDDAAGDSGSISGGWTISFTTVSFPTNCATCALCTLTPPANITVPADANGCTATVTYAAPTTTGTCGTVTCSPASGSVFAKGTTTVTCTSGTGGGVGSFTVTVNDTQAPVIVCPANITVSTATNTCAATVTYATPTVTDNCPGVNAAVCVPASGTSFNKGTTTVNCTVTDGSGNPASCSFTVTVNDTQAPAITCPANIFVGTTGTTQVVTYAAPTVSDNCPGVQAPVCVPASGFAFPVGVTTVNCSVRDAVNNTSACSFQVTVNKVVQAALSDPLACTGAGNVINGSFALTNNGGVNQNVVATASFGPKPPAPGILFPHLLVLTCTVTGPGTCVIAPDQTSVSYTGTLTSGQSATISYQLQVNDGVLPGAVLTSNVTATFNGGPPITATASLTANCQAAGPGPTYPATSEVTDQKPGSVLVYPVYTSSVAGNTQNSRISITNTHPNLRAWVHLFFVSDACAVSDAFLCLTPNQTTTFLASDLDPGTTGYLVAVATNGTTGCPIDFNYLIGDAYVKFSTGHAANLGAESISAIAGSAFWVSCNNNAVLATLPFDGRSYNRLPYVLAVDNIGSRADGNDTIVVLDRIGGDLRTGPSGVGNVFGVFYNDSEAQLSFTLNSTSCQYRFTVNNTTPRTTPRFEQFVTAGRTGWMKFYQRDGNALLGSVINFNPNAGTSAGAFSQGHNLHALTLTDTATYIIPVFPPSC